MNATSDSRLQVDPAYERSDVGATVLQVIDDLVTLQHLSNDVVQFGQIDAPRLSLRRMLVARNECSSVLKPTIFHPATAPHSG